MLSIAGRPNRHAGALLLKNQELEGIFSMQCYNVQLKHSSPLHEVGSHDTQAKTELKISAFKITLKDIQV